MPSSYLELQTSKPINDPLQISAVCLRPGVYNYQVSVPSPSRGIGLPVAYLLQPGVYFFNHGVTVQGPFVGGFTAGNGVALVFHEANNEGRAPGQFITKTGSSLVALNFGTAYPTATSGTKSQPAKMPDGALVQTSSDNPLPLTVMVRPDPTCVVGPTAPSACRENLNSTISLTGTGNTFIAGVVYAPSDNVTFSGNTSSTAELGQVWAWTMKFDSAFFNLRSSNTERLGVLRLDRACSPSHDRTPDCKL